MTYKPDSGDNINFDIESYNPPFSNDFALYSQATKQYYIAPNADDVVIHLEHYSLENIDFELTSSDVIKYYQIPQGNLVDFTLEEYLETSTNFDITPETTNEDTEISILFSSKIDSKLFISSGVNPLFKIKSNFNTKIDYTINGLLASAKSEAEVIVLYDNELYIPITSRSRVNVELTETITPKFEVNFDFTTKINQLLDISISSKTDFTSTFSFGLDLLYVSKSNFNIHFTLNAINEILMILSPNFELIAYLEDYSDFVWNRRWRKVDDFNLSINYEMKNAKYLQLGNYLAKKKGDIIHAGRIGSRNLKSEGDTQQLQISGKGLGEVFDSRIAFHKVNENDGYDTFAGPAESAMRHYVDVNVINPDDESRAVSRLKLEKDNQKGAVIHYKARFQKLSEILYEISKTTGLGWDVQLDLENRDFIFKVLKAKIRKGVRLSPNFESVQMINFKENKSELENTIMIAGQGEGSDRMVRTVSRNEV